MKEIVKVEISKQPGNTAVITYELPLLKNKTPFESALIGLSKMYGEELRKDREEFI